jgi:hypothetical protein
VFGHNRIASHHEPIALASLLQQFKKESASLRSGEKRQAAVTAASDEMQMTSAVISVPAPGNREQRSAVRRIVKVVGHRGNQKPRPCTKRKDGAPATTSENAQYKGCATRHAVCDE